VYSFEAGWQELARSGGLPRVGTGCFSARAALRRTFSRSAKQSVDAAQAQFMLTGIMMAILIIYLS
jgi:hypothetical protein